MHSAPAQAANDPRHMSRNDNPVSVNAPLPVEPSGACPLALRAVRGGRSRSADLRLTCAAALAPGTRGR